MKKFKFIFMSVVAMLWLALAGSCSSDEPVIMGEEQSPVVDEPAVEEPVVEPEDSVVVDDIDSDLIKVPYVGPFHEFATQSLINSLEKNRDFSWELFKLAVRSVDEKYQGKSANMAFSPYSANMVMAMAANYLDRNTSSQLVSKLGFNTLEDLNEGMALVTAYLMNGKHTSMDFKSNNSLWWRDEYCDYLDNDIVNTLRRNYYIHTCGVDFNQDQTIDLINDWVKTNTNNKIPNFLNYLTDYEKLYKSHINVNTLYLNGEWMWKFQKNKVATFKGTDSNSLINMMNNTHDYGGYVDEDYTYISIPFIFGASMRIIMPKTQSIEEFSRTVSYAQLNEFKQRSYKKHYRMNLTMPKFKIDGVVELSPELLNETGIHFAQAKNMLYGDLLANKPNESNILQKTSVIINEEGAECAAATSHSGASYCPLDREYIEITIDRPFIFYIQEEFSGAIMMAGRICNL
ncbi:MAG: serpin family protein [Muribaculaceae bacterium]